MPEPAFLLDGMLGSLARWLRMIGYDSVYVRDAADGDLLGMLGNRSLLTRDRQLAQRAGPRGFYLESDVLDDQLSAVMERFGLSLEREGTRCTACNGELEKVDKEAVRGRVPEGTWSVHQEFWLCSRCGRCSNIGTLSRFHIIIKK